MSGSIFTAEREMVSEAGTGLGCAEVPGTLTVTMSISSLFRGLGAMRRGFLPEEPPGAGAWTLVGTGSGGNWAW